MSLNPLLSKFINHFHKKMKILFQIRYNKYELNLLSVSWMKFECVSFPLTVKAQVFADWIIEKHLHSFAKVEKMSKM